MEFGGALLSDEDAWFCIATERSERVKTLEGGVAQVFGTILEFLFASGGHSLTNSGVRLDFADGSSDRLYSKLFMILQDGGEHKHVFCVKGDAGLKQCVACRNFYARDSGLVGDAEESILTCASVFGHEMDFATDDDVRGTVRRLAGFKPILEPKLFKLREMACGSNHNKYSMLLNPALDNILQPVSNYAHDWMHAMVVNGVWNTMRWLLIMALVSSGISDAAQQIGAYVRMWTLPRRVSVNAGKLADAFSATRWKSSANAKHFKCTASEKISMYAIIKIIVVSVFLRAGVCVAECQAYVDCCDVLDLLCSQQHGCVTGRQMCDVIDKFLWSCVRARFRNFMHPKFHWTIHFAIELQRFGFLLTCWVHERKHRMVKRFCQEMKNTVAYEISILS